MRPGIGKARVASSDVSPHCRASPLLHRPLVLYFVVAFGSMTCFYLLLSVVPLYATAVGAVASARG